MAIDREDFIKRFKQELKLLENLKDRAAQAHGRAKEKLKLVEEDGRSVEEVFGPVPPKQQD